MVSEPDDSELLRHPPDLRLDGRVAWVTGAGRGLGRALAFALAGAGAEVVLSARSAPELEAVAETIRGAGGSAHALPGSVADPKAVAATVAEVERLCGRLDLLVNNAGISPAFKRAELIGDDDWLAVMDVNLRGPYACARAALPLLEASSGASVVNISSVHGFRAHERMLAYAASKGGLEMVTRTLAVEWAARGIRVNSVAPGYVETDLTSGLAEHPHWGEQLRGRIPMGRFARPSEIVGSVLFLASPAASYVTGATLLVDGGWTAL